MTSVAEPTFHKIESNHPLYIEVVKQIEGKIVAGEINAGDMLPPERVLAEQLNVSRTVIREAVKALEMNGMVEVQRGRGIMVADLSPNSVTDSMIRYLKIQKSPVWALLEVRRVLELEIAMLAAERRTEADLQEMDDLITQMEIMLEVPNRYVELDFEFHQALARAAHNPLFPVVTEPLTMLMRESRRIGAKAPNAPKRSITIHQRILEAVRNQDAEAAVAATRDHFKEVEAFIAEAESGPTRSNTLTVDDDHA